MCLNTVTRKYKDNEEKEGEGWKVFDNCNSGIYFMHQSLKGKPKVPFSRWLTASKISIQYTTARKVGYYKSGFHIYLEKPNFGSPAETTVKVKFKGGHTMGYQDGLPVIVASKMLVPKQKRGK